MRQESQANVVPRPLHSEAGGNDQRQVFNKPGNAKGRKDEREHSLVYLGKLVDCLNQPGDGKKSGGPGKQGELFCFTAGDVDKQADDQYHRGNDCNKIQGSHAKSGKRHNLSSC